MNSHKIVLFCMTAMIVSSCNCSYVAVIEKNLITDVEIGELSDSTYFQDMRSLVFSDGKLYCDEKNRSQILVLNQDLTLRNTISHMGRGESSLLHIGNIAVYGDTVIVKDGGNARMQLFHSNGDYISSESSLYETTFWPFFRFVYRDGMYSSDARNHPNNALVTCSPTDGTVRYFGERYVFSSTKQNIIRNHRFLLCDGECLISVSDNVPIVEKYSYKTGELLSTFDLSDTKPIRSRMDIIAKEPFKDNGYSFYLTDVNMWGNKIFVLCNTKTANDYYANEIIVLDCKDEMKVESILHLPEKIYGSIAISDRYLYAFSNDKNKLQRFEL